VKAQTQPDSANSQILPKHHLLRLAFAFLVVVAAGLISGSGRVEIASPFTARQAAVQVIFYDGETGEVIEPNAIQLLPLALQRRLGYQAEIYRPKPDFLKATLQSLLAWLSLWLALGLTVWAIKRSLVTLQWLQIGEIAGWLMVWRLLQAISVSCWVWLPNWRSDLVIGLLDLVQGHPVPSNLAWAVLWRGAIWLAMGIATFVHIFIAFRRKFAFSRLVSLLSMLATYLVARLIYALSTGQLWQ
jgi:hypothetical protein